MAELQEVESTKLNKKYAHKKKLGFLKMKVITKGFSEPLFTPIVNESVEPHTIIKSDGSTSYNELKNKFDHRPETIPKKEAGKI